MLMNPSHPPLPPEAMRRPCLQLDLSRSNTDLETVDVADPEAFGRWLADELQRAGCDWAAGGYAEDRALYAMSPVFGSGGDVRCVHLGVDLWMPAGTPVYCVAGGRVHSFADNSRFGDYGPTIIIEHRQDDGAPLFSLYGHLARRSLEALEPGQPVAAGATIGWLGEPGENLGWCPHLHFQLIRDLAGSRGDFPGVCHRAEQSLWLERCPSPLEFLQPWMGEQRQHAPLHTAEPG